MKRRWADLLEQLFPAAYDCTPLVSYIDSARGALAESMPGEDRPRVPGWNAPDGYEQLASHYAELPEDPALDAGEVVRQISKRFLAGAVSWRCPDLQYNLGAAVNAAASAAYGIALDVNVYLINDGLAGNAIIAENAVASILTGLAGLPKGQAHGVFTFGGTGTMMYAIKVGTRKVSEGSGRTGIPRGMKVLITEDAHFSHAVAADWLGIGVDNLLVARPGPTRRTLVSDAEQLLREALEAGHPVPTMIINGGTTYDHAIDDIPAFVALRDQLVVEYGLDYVPHIHVDSVIGWVWLVYQGYDIERNPLEIEPTALAMLRTQYARIRHLRLADSWGVDFHKGAGACPVDCSFVVMNDRADLMRLKKGGSPVASIHQLAEDFSSQSPVDYTLETSRAGGKAMAALTSFHTLGRTGYRLLLRNLIERTVELRRLVTQTPGMAVLNDYALGYQTMIRLYPPERMDDPRLAQELSASDPSVAAFIEEVNAYLLAFFTWDNATRMDVNGGGVVYSFSKKFVRAPSGCNISGLKWYPVSPRIATRHVEAAVALLRRQKDRFDVEIWARRQA